MATLENTHPNNPEEQPPTTTPTKSSFTNRSNKRVSISPKKPIVHSPRIRSTNSRFVPNDDDDDDSLASNNNSNTKKKPKLKKRRRRSSARFLRLSQGGGDNDDADRQPADEEEELASSEHLGEIYRQAIRMNAENKINAGNSWGLRLIENMDKFIEEVSMTLW